MIPAVLAEEWVEWGWVADHTDDIVAALREHVVLTVAAVGLGLLVALPLGMVASRRPRLQGPALAVTGTLFTIPSLAFFVMLGPWTGFISLTTALIPLVAYTLLILVRNVMAGLEAVPDDIKEAATGMGYGAARRLVQVEMPLALPAIVAGVRIATVTTVGLVTVAFVVGHGGLGELILLGLNRDFRTPTVVGSVLCVALAVVADLSLVAVERLLSPWARRER